MGSMGSGHIGGVSWDMQLLGVVVLRDGVGVTARLNFDSQYKQVFFDAGFGGSAKIFPIDPFMNVSCCSGRNVFMTSIS